MFKRWLVMAGVTLALIGGSSGVAFAEGNEHASCIGLDASTNAPVNERIHVFQQAVGVPFGAFVSQVAQLHEGTEEACVGAAPGG